jgi:hypothetical protein
MSWDVANDWFNDHLLIESIDTSMFYFPRDPTPAKPSLFLALATLGGFRLTNRFFKDALFF